MLSMHNLAVAFSERLVAALPPERRQPHLKEIVAFGLEVGLGSIWELLVILGAAALLGFLPQVALALLAAGSFRLCAGGAHCTAYYRCFISSLATFCVLGWAASFLALHSASLLALGAWFLTGVAGFYAVARWAPAATPNAPIGPARRPRLRQLSFLCLAFWLVLAGIMYFNGWKGTLFWALMLALLMQSYTISPSGYRLMAALDRTLKVLLPLERINWREEAKKC